MTTPDSVVAELATDVRGLSARVQAPAVAIAAVTTSGVEVATAGTATPDTRFRPGSTTKLITATLVFQLAAEGLLELDQPLHTVVPELELADADLSRPVRIRHLVSHSSGIDAGDVFVDTGTADDCLDRYVDVLQGRGFLFPPGTTFSYNNAGFVLAGLVVARLRGTTYEDAARAHLLEPLGMSDTTFVTDVDAAGLDGDHALGNLTSPSMIGDVGFRCLAPAGGTLMSTAVDLARLVEAHLGLRPDVLDERAASAMRALQAPAPGGVPTMRGAAFGWMVWDNARGSTVRIGGGFPGFSAMLVADPPAGAGLAVLSNSDVGINAVTAALDASGPPPALSAPPRAVELTAYAGEYASHALRCTVHVEDGTLQVTAAELGAAVPLVPLDGQTFASAAGPVAFVDMDGDGRVDGLRWRMRVMRRC